MNSQIDWSKITQTIFVQLILQKENRMTKLEPIIAVKDIEISAHWYESVLDCTNTHGADHFAVLVAKNGEDYFACTSGENTTTLP